MKQKNQCVRTCIGFTPRFSSRKLESLFCSGRSSGLPIQIFLPVPKTPKQWIEANLNPCFSTQAWLTAAGTAHDLHVIPF